jgi:hypothetical protein
MSIPEALASRLDRINRIHTSSLEVLGDSYKQYQTVKDMHDKLVIMELPDNETCRIKHQKLLETAKTNLADLEKQVQRCMHNLEEVSHMRQFIEDLVNIQG